MDLDETVEKIQVFVASQPKGMSYRDLAKASESCMINDVHSVMSAYNENHNHVVAFAKAHRRIQRRIRHEFETTLAAICVRGYKRAAKFAGIPRKDNLLSDLVIHIALADNLYIEFDHIINVVESYIQGIKEYHDMLSARLEDSIVCWKSADGREEESDSLSKDIVQMAETHPDKALAKVRADRARFDLYADNLDMNRRVLCSKLSVSVTDQDMIATEQSFTHLNNMINCCEGVCINLKSIREHLGMFLPIYLNGAFAAKTVKNMEKTLDLMVGLTANVFQKYMDGFDYVQGVFNQQRASSMYSGFGSRMSAKNALGFNHLARCDEDLSRRMKERGYD